MRPNVARRTCADTSSIMVAIANRSPATAGRVSSAAQRVVASMYNGKRGTAHHSARLNPDKVRAIRALQGNASLSEIARQFDVSHVAIWKVINRQSWKDVR